MWHSTSWELWQAHVTQKLGIKLCWKYNHGANSLLFQPMRKINLNFFNTQEPKMSDLWPRFYWAKITLHKQYHCFVNNPFKLYEHSQMSPQSATGWGVFFIAPKLCWKPPKKYFVCWIMPPMYSWGVNWGRLQNNIIVDNGVFGYRSLGMFHIFLIWLIYDL